MKFGETGHKGRGSTFFTVSIRNLKDIKLKQKKMSISGSKCVHKYVLYEECSLTHHQRSPAHQTVGWSESAQ